jgi:hypothetical protein
MFGINFRPLGITAFTRVPVDEITDQAIELELLETLFDESFNDFKTLSGDTSTDFRQKKSIFIPTELNILNNFTPSLIHKII